MPDRLLSSSVAPAPSVVDLLCDADKLSANHGDGNYGLGIGLKPHCRMLCIDSRGVYITQGFQNNKVPLPFLLPKKPATELSSNGEGLGGRVFQP
jgi:hypothetical protein